MATEVFGAITTPAPHSGDRRDEEDYGIGAKPPPTTVVVNSVHRILGGIEEQGHSYHETREEGMGEEEVKQ